MLRPCLDCGRLAQRSRCPHCRRKSPYQQPEWRALSKFVIARDGCCVDCHSTGPFLMADHVIPRAEGGADHPANLETRCAGCHARADAKRRRYPG